MKRLNAFLAIATILALGSCAGNKQQDEAAASANDSNQVIETIMQRRSIRKYKDQPVEREKLETITNCGINAPSGMNRQPWQVRVVDNPDYINGISEIFKATNPAMAADSTFRNIFRNAPAVIFIAAPADGSGQLDCGLLGENMILAAQSLGLGTCCLGGPINFMLTNPDAAEYVKKLDIPEDYKLLYAIGVGYPDEAPDAKPRDASKVKFID
jgi:nitroreductase